MTDYPIPLNELLQLNLSDIFDFNWQFEKFSKLALFIAKWKEVRPIDCTAVRIIAVHNKALVAIFHDLHRNILCRTSKKALVRGCLFVKGCRMGRSDRFLCGMWHY